jgi:hypothetical protein
LPRILVGYLNLLFGFEFLGNWHNWWLNRKSRTKKDMHILEEKFEDAMIVLKYLDRYHRHLRIINQDGTDERENLTETGIL